MIVGDETLWFGRTTLEVSLENLGKQIEAAQQTLVELIVLLAKLVEQEVSTAPGSQPPASKKKNQKGTRPKKPATGRVRTGSNRPLQRVLNRKG